PYLKRPWCTCANYLPEQQRQVARRRLQQQPFVHVLLAAHVESPQSPGLVGVREGPLDQLAPTPQQLLTATATDPLPIRIDCRLPFPLSRPSAVRGAVRPSFMRVISASGSWGLTHSSFEPFFLRRRSMRRDTTESYTEYLKGLAEATGLEATDEATLRRTIDFIAALASSVVASMPIVFPLNNPARVTCRTPQPKT